MKIKLTYIALLSFTFLIAHIQPAFSWHDETHMAVAKAAGYYKWYNAAGADITKIKAGAIEKYNHFYNNNLNANVTAEQVLTQTRRYNNPNNPEGHLYGAIIASLRDYADALEKKKYVEYHLAYCAHYIGDLSQPLHNIPYDSFNKKYHSADDGRVDREVLSKISKIRESMYRVHIRPGHFEQDLAGEVARIANLSRLLGHKLKKENRTMTKKEAYIQLGHSASLLKAVLKHLGKSGQGRIK